MYTKVNVRYVSMMGVLVALEIVLARFTIHTLTLKIGFGFVPVVVAGILYGPMAAGLVGAIGDILSFLLFPVGAFCPGFTLTAFLTGIVFGDFLEKKQSTKNIVLSVLITQLLISQIINTFFISILYGSPFEALFVTRTIQTLLMIIIQIACIELICRKLVPILRKYEGIN